MIVREAGTTLLVIRQPDHAALSRRIMEPSVPLARAARRESILHALGEHDNGWREVEAAPAIDPATGRLLDFVSVPTSVRQAVWPRAVARLEDDPWAAALVAEHAIVAYDRFRADPEWRQFFRAMAAARDRYVEETERSLDELQRDYGFLRLGDLASLAFCMAAAGEHRFGDSVVRLEDDRVVITPDPYAGQTVPFEIAARELPTQVFASDADARAALESAPIVSLKGSAVGANG